MIRDMGNAAQQYIVGPDGRKHAVLLDIVHYRRLLRKIEDLEDALALDRAEQTSKKLVSYTSARSRLRRAGKL